MWFTTSRNLVEEGTLNKLTKVPECCISNPCYQPKRQLSGRGRSKRNFHQSRMVNSEALQSTDLKGLYRVMEEPSPKACYVTRAKVLPALGATHSPLCTCTQSEPGATSGPKASSCTVALVPVKKSREAAVKLPVGSGPQNTRIPTSRANTMIESVPVIKQYRWLHALLKALCLCLAVCCASIHRLTSQSLFFTMVFLSCFVFCLPYFLRNRTFSA